MEGEDDSKKDGLRLRGKRLRQAVDAVDAVGSRRVAEAAGVPYTTLRGYMAGGEMKLSVLASVARACGVTIDWIAYGGGSTVAPVSSAGGDPTGRVSVAADAGLLDLQRPAVRLGVDAGELVAFTAVGDAMEPTIRDGDLLVARPLERVVAPAIYAIRTGDDIAARRLEHRVDGALIVNTDNPRHGAQVIPPGQEQPSTSSGRSSGCLAPFATDGIVHGGRGNFHWQFRPALTAGQRRTSGLEPVPVLTACAGMDRRSQGK